MTRVDKPTLPRQLFELGPEYSGHILPDNKMLRQLARCAPQHLDAFVEILDLLETTAMGRSCRCRADIRSVRKFAQHRTKLLASPAARR